jgi:hypothetical protein
VEQLIGPAEKKTTRGDGMGKKKKGLGDFPKPQISDIR